MLGSTAQGIAWSPKAIQRAKSPLLFIRGLFDFVWLQVVTSTYWAVQKYQSTVQFAIYSCTNNTDRYTDSESMKKLGWVNITIDNPILVQNPDKYTFTVTFTLGSLELKVMATDDQTKRQAKTQVLFVAD